MKFTCCSTVNHVTLPPVNTSLSTRKMNSSSSNSSNFFFALHTHIQTQPTFFAAICNTYSNDVACISFIIFFKIFTDHTKNQIWSSPNGTLNRRQCRWLSPWFAAQCACSTELFSGDAYVEREQACWVWSRLRDASIKKTAISRKVTRTCLPSVERLLHDQLNWNVLSIDDINLKGFHHQILVGIKVEASLASSPVEHEIKHGNINCISNNDEWNFIHTLRFVQAFLWARW